LGLGDFDDGRGSEAGEGSRLSKPLDVEEFRKHAHQMVDFVADYHRDIESFPVRSQVKVRFFFKKIKICSPLSLFPILFCAVLEFSLQITIVFNICIFFF
jgi:hypothetical protein